MVVIQPFLIPKRWWRTFASGARQFVVHEAFEMIWCFAGSYFSSFTPRTTVMSGPLAGAVMTTFLAPAVRCLAASSRLVKSPVDSNTTSTPRSFQGSCAGSRIDSTLNSSPSTEMPSPCASTFACRLPSTESYFSRCASVCGVGEIVDRHEIDVLVAERRAHDVAADAAESVDADPVLPSLIRSRWSTYTVRRYYERARGGSNALILSLQM